MFSAPERAREAKPHTRWAVALGLGILGTVIVTVVVLAFLWPTKTATPQGDGPSRVRLRLAGAFGRGEHDDLQKE